MVVVVVVVVLAVFVVVVIVVIVVVAGGGIVVAVVEEENSKVLLSVAQFICVNSSDFRSAIKKTANQYAGLRETWKRLGVLHAPCMGYKNVCVIALCTKERICLSKNRLLWTRSHFLIHPVTWDLRWPPRS